MAATFGTCFSGLNPTCMKCYTSVHAVKAGKTNCQFIGQDVAISGQYESKGIQTILNVSCTHDKNLSVAAFSYQSSRYYHYYELKASPLGEKTLQKVKAFQILRYVSLKYWPNQGKGYFKISTIKRKVCGSRDSSNAHFLAPLTNPEIYTVNCLGKLCCK